MKKRIMLLSIGVLFALFMSLGVTAFADNVNNMTIAEDGPAGVKCNCAMGNGKGCKADFYGARCNPDGTSDCWSYDGNCSQN